MCESASRKERPILPMLVLAALGVPAAVAAQRSPEPALDYGPNAVGFTVVEALDSSRAFRPQRDFRGRLAAETARPVQVSIWYPAVASPGAARMSAGEFRLLRETEVDFDLALTDSDAERLRADFIDAVVGFGQEPTAAARVWDGATPAIRDAQPLPGPYPTVLYLTAAGVSNPLLPAYLASHGFVVASFPSNGRMTDRSLEFSPNALTLDTDIDDAGFVHSLLRRLPHADTRRLAVASFSSGSLAALLWAMRDMQVGAIVAVEGWERYRRGADIIVESVHYEPHRVRVPFLMIERAADEASPRYAKVPDVVGALSYAHITRVSFHDASHGDFLSHVTFGHTPHHAEIYEASARMIRRFLQTTLGDGGDAAPLASITVGENPIFGIDVDPAVGPVPTEEELYRLAETDPAAATEAYRQARRLVPGRALFRMEVLTRAARFTPSPEDSAAIMRLVADAYPDSAAGTPAPLAGAAPAFLAISVSDLEAATAWYRQVLGVEPVREVASADSVLRARLLFFDPVAIELIHHRATLSKGEILDPGAHRFQIQGIVKAGIFVDDIDRLHQHLREQGVNTDARIGVDSLIGARFFVFRDPDGNSIQVFERCAGPCD